MNAYENIEKIGTFTLMRPIFIVLFIVLILIFFSIVTPTLNEKMMNGFFVVTFSVVSIYLSALVLFYNSVLVEQMNVNGDPAVFYLFLAIVFLGLLNPFLYFSGRSSQKSNLGNKRIHHR